MDMTVSGTTNKFLSAIAFAFAALLAASCGKDPDFGIHEKEGTKATVHGPREAFVETRKVLLFYECGMNSLYSYLDEDMNKELVQGYSQEDQEANLAKAYIPGASRNSDVLLVYSKLAKSNKYAPQKSYLKRIYLDHSGTMVMDTLKIWDENAISTSPSLIREVLSFVKDAFPAKGYGMVFSSHASGWYPAGYFPDAEEITDNPNRFSIRKAPPAGTSGSFFPVPYSEPELPEGALLTRSIGVDVVKNGHTTLSYELNVNQLASAIPMHLDYLLFDCCLMGGVEVFHGLKDVADYVASPVAEVLAQGSFDYTTITKYLLQPPVPDVKGLYEASFNRYDSGVDVDARSFVVSLVKTGGMAHLAEVCKPVFERYRSTLASFKGRDVQNFGGRKLMFYDMVDMLRKAGVSEQECNAVQAAIDDCIVFKGSTPAYYSAHGGMFEVDTFCGMTMFLPYQRTDFLSSHYCALEWNLATQLLK